MNILAVRWDLDDPPEPLRIADARKSPSNRPACRKTREQNIQVDMEETGVCRQHSCQQNIEWLRVRRTWCYGSRIEDSSC